MGRIGIRHEAVSQDTCRRYQTYLSVRKDSVSIFMQCYTLFLHLVWWVFFYWKKKIKKGNVKMNKIISMVLAVAVMVCAISVFASWENNPKDAIENYQYASDVLFAW